MQMRSVDSIQKNIVAENYDKKFKDNEGMRCHSTSGKYSKKEISKQ